MLTAALYIAKNDSHNLTNLIISINPSTVLASASPAQLLVPRSTPFPGCTTVTIMIPNVTAHAVVVAVLKILLYIP